MRVYFFLGFLGVLVFGFGGFFFCVFHDTSSQGLQSKAEWGDLQGSKEELSSKVITEATIVRLPEGAILEVPGSQTGGPGLVILLSPKAEPYYKQMPEGFYRLSQADFAKVKGSGLASETVLAVLSSHVDSRSSQ